jgi:hypothetical protein
MWIWRESALTASWRRVLSVRGWNCGLPLEIAIKLPAYCQKLNNFDAQSPSLLPTLSGHHSRMTQEEKIIQHHYSILQTLHRHKQHLLLSVHTKVTVNYVTVYRLTCYQNSRWKKKIRERKKNKKYRSIGMKNR